VTPVYSRAPFTNKNAGYLLACSNNRASYLGTSDLIVMSSIYLPRTPFGRFQSRFVGAAQVR
jgi:hypothetical protein